MKILSQVFFMTNQLQSKPMADQANSKRACIILAAGKGTRMRTQLTKVLHKVGGRTMLDLAVDAAFEMGCSRVVIVVGNHVPEVRQCALKRVPEADVVIQDPPLGTGHAVLAAQAALGDFEGKIIIAYADCPLMSAEVLSPVLDQSEAADMVVLGFEARDPGAYGRLVTKPSAEGLECIAIVEAIEATDEQKAITICNSGVLALEAKTLFSLLEKIDNKNAKGEYYLTDIVALARNQGLRPMVTLGLEDDVLGVNCQSERALAEALWQGRARQKLMDQGVIMIAPETVFLNYDTKIASDVVLEPNIIFGAGVTIERGAQILGFSHIEGAHIGHNARIGPFARLRAGSEIGTEVHIGNFVEVKNIKIAMGAKANHLSYLGDGTIGEGSNIGAGTIFCNYDGFFKAQTTIGNHVFVGSNSALVAPVTLNDDCLIASGSVITDDVEAGAMAFGRARQVNKPGAGAAFKRQQKAAKAAQGQKL